MSLEAAARVRPARAADLSAIMALLDDDAIARSRDAAGPAPADAAERAFAEIERDPNSTIYVLEREARSSAARS